MSDLLQLMVSEGGADLHVRVGIPPVIRIHGVLQRVDGPVLRPEDTEELMRSITSEDHIQQIREKGGADFGFAFGELARFRVSAFKEKGNFALVLRQIPSKLLTMEQIGIPPTVKELIYKPRGLVLVTGPTGSGKTTTLASLLNIINEESNHAHIITIEDPIEYIFNDAKATINQREIGIDATNFNDALRALVRENPDVVLVGEMRDYETFEAAIRAAETGHLVFGTIHASSAWQTFGRIYDLFPENERDQIRKLLAYNLRAIIYQKLLPTLHAHIARIPAIEILLNNPAVQKYILEGREGELLEIIKQSHDEGMLDFTSALVKLVEENYIHQRVALEATPKPEELKMRLKGIG